MTQVPLTTRYPFVILIKKPFESAIRASCAAFLCCLHYPVVLHTCTRRISMRCQQKAAVNAVKDQVYVLCAVTATRAWHNLWHHSCAGLGRLAAGKTDEQGAVDSCKGRILLVTTVCKELCACLYSSPSINCLLPDQGYGTCIIIAATASDVALS